MGRGAACLAEGWPGAGVPGSSSGQAQSQPTVTVLGSRNLIVFFLFHYLPVCDGNVLSSGDSTSPRRRLVHGRPRGFALGPWQRQGPQWAGSANVALSL